MGLGIITSSGAGIFWCALAPLWLGLIGLGMLTEARARAQGPGLGPLGLGPSQGADPGVAWLRPLWACLCVSSGSYRGGLIGPCSAQLNLGHTSTPLILAYAAWAASLGLYLLGRVSAPGRSLSPSPILYIWFALIALLVAPCSGTAMAAILCLEILSLCAMGSLASAPSAGPGSPTPLALVYWASATSAVLTLWGLGLGVGAGGSLSGQGSGLSAPNPQAYLLVSAGLGLKVAAAPLQWWAWAAYAGLGPTQLGTYLIFFSTPTLAIVLWLVGSWAPALTSIRGPLSLAASSSLPLLWLWARRTSACSGLFVVSSSLGSSLLLASLGA